MIFVESDYFLDNEDIFRKWELLESEDILEGGPFWKVGAIFRNCGHFWKVTVYPTLTSSKSCKFNLG